MKTHLPKLISKYTPTVAACAGLLAALLLMGCKTEQAPPPRSGFLSSYTQMEKVDETTWRWIDPNNRLGSYNKFILHPVKVQAEIYDGEKISPETRERVSNYLHDAIEKALSDRYPIVSAPSTDTGEIRVGITDATKTGRKLNLCVEGEIQDSYSAVQVASVVASRLGKARMGSWWDQQEAKDMMDAWAKALRQTIDKAHAR